MSKTEKSDFLKQVSCVQNCKNYILDFQFSQLVHANDNDE